MLLGPQNPQLPTCAKSGCEKQFESWYEVYRCYDCEMPFHRGCLTRHADDWKYLHPLPNTLARRTPYSRQNYCYCQCTDGDPRSCRGWKGQQDEPPCKCICHDDLPDAEIERLLELLKEGRGQSYGMMGIGTDKLRRLEAWFAKVDAVLAVETKAATTSENDNG